VGIIPYAFNFITSAAFAVNISWDKSHYYNLLLIFNNLYAIVKSFTFARDA